MSLLPLLGYVLGVNILTALAFQHDKRRSQTGGWRIPENALLGLSILGGSIGAKFAQLKYRHKTRKQPFATLLNVIFILQILLILALALPQTRALLLAPQ